MEFGHEQLVSGRCFRALDIIDDFTRIAVAIVVDTSTSGKRVARVLNDLATTRGLPKVITCDNGTEFTSKARQAWSIRHLRKKWSETQERWKKVEDNLAIRAQEITRALRQDTEIKALVASKKEIKEALLALEETATKVQKCASHGYTSGDSEFFRCGPAKPTRRTTGLRLVKHRGQKQSIFPQKYGEWAIKSQKAAEQTP